MEPDWLRPQLVPNDRRQARGTTTCETYLGLHHGPMSYVHGDTPNHVLPVVRPNASRAWNRPAARVRSEERGLLKIILGKEVPRDVPSEAEVLIECKGW